MWLAIAGDFMNRERQKPGNKGAAVKCSLLSFMLAFFGLLAPSSVFAVDNCSDFHDDSPGGCETNCLKNGSYCSSLDAPSPPGWSWSSNNTLDCVPETPEPSDPPNGSYYPPMNCNNNTWPLHCNAGYTTCDNTTCHADITIDNCALVNQCTDRCTSCNSGYTSCDSGVTCHANITISNCATVNQCTDQCTTCNTGYELVGGACVGATLKLSGGSVKADQDIAQSPEPAGIYVTADRKVGISTGNPSYMLHVATGAGETGTLMAISTGNTNILWVAGDGVHATKFFGDISGASGFPSSGGDNLGNHIATDTLNMNGNQIVNISSLTVAGSAGAAISRLYLSQNVELSSTTQANYGGVYASSHVFVNGDLRAVKIYGDISDTTGFPSASGDSLGTHVATTTLNMNSWDINSVSTVAFKANVFISSASVEQYGGVYVSTNIYLPAGAKYYGDGSGLSNLTSAGDNLGNHVATTTLDMSNKQIVNVSSLTITGQDAATGYSLWLSSGINMAGGNVNAGTGYLIGNGSQLTSLNAGLSVTCGCQRMWTCLTRSRP